MKKIILALLIACNCMAQPQITWQKYFYTSTGNNVMNYIVEMEDSGFVTGTVMPQFNPSCRIIRTDKSG
ncbi:MAG: hypothetical protein JNK61_00280, partial [Bacteroidia bacterium]|nr:hypothetical protein [Bacteroidia bacterium]